jgi:NAD(P) transhydrogenase
LGTRVHLVDGRDVLLPFLDSEVSQALAKAMEHGGITFHWKERVQACVAQQRDYTSERPARVSLTLSSKVSLTVDAVLVAAGRKSNTEDLNLAAAGVETGQRGLIVARTSAPTSHTSTPRAT